VPTTRVAPFGINKDNNKVDKQFGQYPSESSLSEWYLSFSPAFEGMNADKNI